RDGGCGFVAVLRLDEAELLQIAGERGLRDAQLARCKTAAQIFLISNALVGDEAQNLSLAKCLSRVHRLTNHPKLKYTRDCIFIQPTPNAVNVFIGNSPARPNGQALNPCQIGGTYATPLWIFGSGYYLMESDLDAYSMPGNWMQE